MGKNKSNKSWLKCKIAYEKSMSNGAIKTVTESYLVSAETFTDAESILSTELLENSVTVEYVVKSIQKMNIFEFAQDSSYERFYKVKVGFISLDERNGVEKRKYAQMIVQADNVRQVLEKVEKRLKDGICGDFEVHTVSETDVISVL